MAKFYAPTKISENIHETPEGFLLCLSVPIARTGWMDYAEGETPLEAVDGKVKIFRDAKEVFHPDTIASFEGKAVTIKHPENFVDPDNWADLAKGSIQNVRRADGKDEEGEESLLADLLITEAFAIKLVKSGLREVSCGYEAEYEQTGKGEGRQTKIIGNHLALVEQGRAGSTYAINDEKGKVIMKEAIEILKKKFGAKVVDEAMKESEKKVSDADMYDELVKMVKDIGEKMTRVEGFMKQGEEDGGGKGINKEDKSNAAGKDEDAEEKKDDESKDEDDKEKEEKSKDDMEASEDDDDKEMKMEERLKALEAAVAKLLDKKTGDEDEEKESEDADEEKEDKDESEDAEGEEGEESKKDSKKTGDSASKKKTGLEKTKEVKDYKSFDSKNEEITAEKMNELNAAHWGRK